MPSSDMHRLLSCLQLLLGLLVVIARDERVWGASFVPSSSTAPRSCAICSGTATRFRPRRHLTSSPCRYWKIDKLQGTRRNHGVITKLVRPSWATTTTSLSSSSSETSSRTDSSTTLLPPAISIEGLSCTHDGGSTYQLRDVSYVLPRGAKVGLLGRNGSGKSTFLRILSMATTTDGSSGNGGDDSIVYTGRIETGKNCRVAFVEQEPPMPSDLTVSCALLGVVSSSSAAAQTPSEGSSVSPYEAARQYKVAEINAPTDPDTYGAATALMDAKSGSWAVLTKAEEIATRLHVQHLADQPLSSLSGGERKRVALAAALVQEPDVLLLDEPSNHLDLYALRWLSDLLKEQKKMTCLIVTHDRAFLDDVCRDGMLELDRGRLHAYEGSYADYLRGKEKRLAVEDAAVASARAKYKTELEWMRRQPQARESKSKARIDAFYKLEKATKPRPMDPSLEIDASKDGQRRIGKNILKCNHVNLSFGERTILDDFTYDFNRGDRIGIVGANGVGKSTFLRVITGKQAADSGEVSTGETVQFGIYDQLGLVLDDEDQRVMDFVKDSVVSGDGSSMAEAPQEAMKLLRRFEFPSDRWNERVSTLSGGERKRLQLLSVLSKRPNFLIMDEPTNDLDLYTLSALERYLEEFQGVLVVVSHDRFFTDKVTDHLFVFEGNGVVKDYVGSLSDYAECLLVQEGAGGSASAGNSADEGKKLSHKENKEKRLGKQRQAQRLKRELKSLEPAIERLKVKAEKVQHEIDNTGNDEGWSVLADLTSKLDELNDEIEQKEVRWLELAEILEQEESEALQS